MLEKNMMAKFWRSWHKSLSIIIVLPFIITTVTGMFLLFRDRANWINPKPVKSVTTNLTISFDQILEASKSVPEMGTKSWDDIGRIQIKPSAANIIVRGKNGYQIQVDGETAQVLSGGAGQSSLLISLHEGTFWVGNWGRYIITLPMALLLFFLSMSGIVLYFQPLVFKKSLRKKAKK